MLWPRNRPLCGASGEVLAWPDPWEILRERGQTELGELFSLRISLELTIVAKNKSSTPAQPFSFADSARLSRRRPKRLADCRSGKPGQITPARPPPSDAQRYGQSHFVQLRGRHRAQHPYETGQRNRLGLKGIG